MGRSDILFQTKNYCQLYFNGTSNSIQLIYVVVITKRCTSLLLPFSSINIFHIRLKKSINRVINCVCGESGSVHSLYYDRDYRVTLLINHL